MSSPTLAPFPNPVLALIALLDGLAHTATTTPPAWNGTPPYLRLRVLGGSDDFFNDQPIVDVDALTTTARTSDDLAESVRQLLISGPHRVTVTGGQVVVIDKVTTVQRPHPLPWGDNPAVFNTTATYRITARRITP